MIATKDRARIAADMARELRPIVNSVLLAKAHAELTRGGAERS